LTIALCSPSNGRLPQAALGRIKSNRAANNLSRADVTAIHSQIGSYRGGRLTITKVRNVPEYRTKAGKDLLSG
jgi:hypothetical protein